MSHRVVRSGYFLPTVALALLAPMTGGRATAACDFGDVRLQGRALEELQKDPQLAPLELIVVVRDGVATIRGLVPSPELRQRAVECVRQVPEIRAVHSECRIGVPPAPLLQETGPKAEKPPPEAKPDQVARRDEQPGGWIPLAPDALRIEPPKVKEQPPADRVAVTVLPPLWIGGEPLPTPKITRPVSLPKHLPAPATEPAALEEYVRNLTLQDHRFHRLRLDVRAGVVSVSGVAPRWEDVHTLSHMIARTPGVERVVWRDIRTEGNR
jgi:hypothetical protein